MRKIVAVGVTGVALAYGSLIGSAIAADDAVVANVTIEAVATTEIGYATPDIQTSNIARFVDEALSDAPPMMPDPEVTGPIASASPKAMPAEPARPARPADQTVASAATFAVVPAPRPDFESTKNVTNNKRVAQQPEKPDRKVVKVSEQGTPKLQLPVPIVIGAFR